MRYGRILLFILSGFLLLCSCRPVIPKPVTVGQPVYLKVLSEEEWPSIEADQDLESLKKALSGSLSYFKSQPPDRKWRAATREVTCSEMEATLSLLLTILESPIDPKALREEIRTRFNLYRLYQEDQGLPVLITGYYEPTLAGSRQPSSRYRFPVYRLPEDLLRIELGLFSPKYQGQRLVGRLEGNRVVPYYSRREIDRQDRLADRDLEILWVDDLIKLFFLHIQGSGRVVLEDGAVVRLGYQGSNGHAYYAIGRELIRRGALRPEEVSLQSISAYLQDHPEDLDEVLDLNPSYIFFREAPGGPYGSLGVPLTPGRSAAMDTSFFPPGGVIWLEGVKPVFDHRGEIGSWISSGRWMTIQDTGGAIKGPGRLDFFWGNGDLAEEAAGRQKHVGTVYLLLKK